MGCWYLKFIVWLLYPVKTVPRKKKSSFSVLWQIWSHQCSAEQMGSLCCVGAHCFSSVYAWPAGGSCSQEGGSWWVMNSGCSRCSRPSPGSISVWRHLQQAVRCLHTLITLVLSPFAFCSGVLEAHLRREWGHSAFILAVLWNVFL